MLPYKGQTAAVSGRLQIRGWTDKDGNKRRTAEVIADNVYFGEAKRDAEPPATNNFGGFPAPNQGILVADYELPF